MNLKNVRYIDKLKRLGYPLHKTLIIGSGTLALLGLTENDDLDLWVTKDVMQKMGRDKRFNKKLIYNKVMYETKDGAIEVSAKLMCTKGKVEDYLKRAIVVNGFYFKSIEDVLYWKKCMNRPKDREHIKQLQQYQKRNVTELYLNRIMK